MTDEQQVIELLRAANPVPHHRDAMRVVRETDPLWQTIQGRLTDEALDGRTSEEVADRGPTTEEGQDMNDATPLKPRRTWQGFAAGLAAAALVLVVIVAIRPETAGVPTYTGAENLSQLPDYVTPPDEIGAVIGVGYSSVALEFDRPALAPKDCTALGLTDQIESHGYRAIAGQQGAVQLHVARFSDPAAASTLLQRIREDIEDCDRTEHPLFTADFEAISDVDAGDRTFVFSAVDGETRRCWSWTQSGDRIVATMLLRTEPGLTQDQCGEVARLVAEDLERG